VVVQVNKMLRRKNDDDVKKKGPVDDELTGGAISKPRVKLEEKTKKDLKIMEALATQKGGAISKPRVKIKEKTKKDLKIMEALATQKGGAISKPKRFHDFRHKYLYNKLSGKGGALDSRECHDAMHSIMSRYHPSIYNSYVAGKVVDLPRFDQDHEIKTKRSRADPTAHIIDYGGSLNAISHSENGYLTHHNPEFHNFVHIV